MSWKPVFLISASTYETLKDKLQDYYVYECPITILENRGHDSLIQETYTVFAGECSDGYYNLHSILEDHPHYILNSERRNCNNCFEWGKMLSEYKCD